jgi:hypothetical protein
LQPEVIGISFFMLFGSDPKQWNKLAIQLRYGESLKHQESSRTDTTSHSSPLFRSAPMARGRAGALQFPTYAHPQINKENQV